MRIYYFQPWATDGNYGAEINHHCELVPDPAAWICIADQDVMRFSTLHPGHDIARILEKYPDTGLFTVDTNRVANLEQVSDARMFNEDSLEKHFMKARSNRAIYTASGPAAETSQYAETVICRRPISGMVMIFRKSTWQRMGGFADGLLHIDSQFSANILKAGLTIRIIKSVYVLHYYRKVEGGSAPFDKTDHLNIEESKNRRIEESK